MTDYQQIAQEHKLLFGTSEDQRNLFKNLVNDKTHFVYELIQNADDNQSKTLEFRLNEEGLFVSNDGSRFTERDVRSICAIGSSNKDLTQIGTFGIGFKAVHKYTDCPEIYSGGERFRIRDLTQPEGIDNTPPRIAELIAQGKTIFHLHFKNNLRQQDVEQLKDFLFNFKKVTLLFLRHLKTVKWHDEDNARAGSYTCLRQPHAKVPNATQIELTASMNGNDQLSETFLVFSKAIQPRADIINEVLQEADTDKEYQRIKDSAKIPQFIEVAFKLSEGQIAAVNNPVLFAYLPTQKETHLRFLIQARYQTTPARDNIRIDTPWNRWLVEETANFLPEVLEQLKVGGLLDPAFFNVLPLD